MERRGIGAIERVVAVCHEVAGYLTVVVGPGEVRGGNIVADERPCCEQTLGHDQEQNDGGQKGRPIRV